MTCQLSSSYLKFCTRINSKFKKKQNPVNAWSPDISNLDKLIFNSFGNGLQYFFKFIGKFSENASFRSYFGVKPELFRLLGIFFNKTTARHMKI